MKWIVERMPMEWIEANIVRVYKNGRGPGGALTNIVSPSQGSEGSLNQWYQEALTGAGLSEEDLAELELDVKKWLCDFLSGKRPLSWVFER